MRYAAWAIGALLAGAFGAHFLLAERGYVMISFAGYVIEMSVPILLLSLILLYAGIRLLLRIWRAPRQLGAAIARRRHRRAADKLTRGLVHLTEGDWLRGERLLTQGLKGGEAPLVNYLMAARAAQRQGSRERRNEWLRLAGEELPDAAAAVLLTQAELELEAGELEHALATLERILQQHTDHPAALGLMAEVYRGLGYHARLVDILPKLARLKLADEKLEELAVDALEALLDGQLQSEEQVRTLLRSLPAPLRSRPRVRRLQALLFERLGLADEAVAELNSALKRQFEPALVQAYGEVTGSDPLKQLRRAEGWLRQHPEDGGLLVTAARLCMANELWGKARSYLESSLALEPKPASFALYGQLLDRLGEGDAAAQAYRSGLGMVSRAEPGRAALAAPAKPSGDDEQQSRAS
jgi:HemY protein